MIANRVPTATSFASDVDALSWRADSVCRTHPTRLWFATNPRDIAFAKSICAGCTVQSHCLEFALSRPDLLGVWAATTPSERAVIRRTGGTVATTTVVAAATDEPVVSGGPGAEPGDAGRDDLGSELGAGEAVPPQPAGSARGSSAAPDRHDLLAPVESEELLTPAEAARRLGVTPNTVTRWSRAGKIAAIQTIGGHRRYRRSEIDRVLQRFGPLAG